MISKSYKKIITKEEYYKLLSYQKTHELLMGFLEVIETESLKITQEIDENNIDNKLLYGGYTADALNIGSKEALDDMLKLLEIEVEKNKVTESKKEIGKVSKKKFKSGQWAKNKELDKSVVVIDRPEFHDYLLDFVVDEKDGLFVSETWNHDNDELGDVVG